MKKKFFLALILLVGIIATLRVCVNRSLSFHVGYYLSAGNGAHFLIDGNTPIQLSDRSKNEKLFSDLTSGDKICVLHDGVAESYPAQTGAYSISKLSDGSIEDIPVSVLDTLMDMGWSFDGIARAEDTVAVPFPAAVSWGNYGDESLLWARAFNRDKAVISSIRHLPVLRFDSAAELTAFQAEISGKFDTQHGYDEIPSFDTVTDNMDGDFFASSSLLLTYVSAGSCTWRYGISHVEVGKDALTIHVQRTDSFDVGDCAMAGWFITLTVPKDVLDGITVFDADLGNLTE